MRAADTNVLVRLILRDDPVQYVAAAAQLKEGIWVSHLVLAETVWVLTTSYGVPPKTLQQIMAMLLKHESVTIQDSQTVADALALFSSHAKTGFTDCLALAIAAQAGHTPLITFDKLLGKLEGTLLLK